MMKLINSVVYVSRNTVPNFRGDQITLDSVPVPGPTNVKISTTRMLIPQRERIDATISTAAAFPPTLT